MACKSFYHLVRNLLRELTCFSSSCLQPNSPSDLPAIGWVNWTLSFLRTLKLSSVCPESCFCDYSYAGILDFLPVSLTHPIQFYLSPACNSSADLCPSLIGSHVSLFIIRTLHSSTVFLLQCSLWRGEALFVIRRTVHQVCVLKKHLFQQINVFIFIGSLFLNPVSWSLVSVLPDHSCLCCSSPFVIFNWELEVFSSLDIVWLLFYAWGSSD